MTDAYTAAKFLNAALMSAAVFPAYWLAAPHRPAVVRACSPQPQQSRRRRCSTTVSSCPRRSRIRSSSLAVAVLAHALAGRSHRLALAVPAVCLLADRDARPVPRSSRSSTSPPWLSAVEGAIAGTSLPAALRRAARRRAPRSSRARSANTARRNASRVSRTAALAHWALMNGTSCRTPSAWRSSRARSFGLGFMLGRPRSQFERAVAALTVGSLAALHRPGSADRRRARRTGRSSATSSTAHRSSSSPSSPTWNAARRDGSCRRVGLIGALPLARFRCPG